MIKYFQELAKRNNIFKTFRFTNKRSGSVHIDIRFEKGTRNQQ